MTLCPKTWVGLGPGALSLAKARKSHCSHLHKKHPACLLGWEKESYSEEQEQRCTCPAMGCSSVFM